MYWYIPVHTSTYWYVQVHTSTNMYWYIQVHTSTYRYVHVPTIYWYRPVHTSMYWYIEVRTGSCMYLYLLVCTGIYWYILVRTGMYQYLVAWVHAGMHGRVHDGMYQYILVHTSIYSISSYWFILPCTLVDTRWYMTVHGSTQKSCTPEQNSTRKYMKVQGLCTFMYFLVPFYSGVLDFWVLTCTVMYRLVSTLVQGSMNKYEEIE